MFNLKKYINIIKIVGYNADITQMAASVVLNLIMVYQFWVLFNYRIKDGPVAKLLKLASFGWYLLKSYISHVKYKKLYFTCENISCISWLKKDVLCCLN